MGDKLQNCRNGLAQLAMHDDTRIAARSRLYQTAPVDFFDQDWFINLAVRVDTTLSPIELLQRLQSIQSLCGRQAQAVRFGPRVLDLDIILYDDIIMQTETLTIPHPRMHQRRFVLQPLCDMDADLWHPVLQQRAGDLLQAVSDTHQAIEIYHYAY